MNETGTVFNIILGSACNWHCPYCIQEKGRLCNQKHDPDRFCDNLLRFIEEKGITDIKRFSYWGGEPMLYLPQLRTLLKHLTNLKTNKPHRTITNGSLVNSEFIELANHYRMLINVSYHDGQLEDEQWAKCLRIENLNITSLVHHRRTDWEEFHRKWLWLQDRYGRCVNWFVYPMLAVPGVPNEYALTKEDIDRYVGNLYTYLERLEDVFYLKAVSVLFYAFKMGDVSRNVTNFCFNDENYALDLAGNRYLCHHNCSADAMAGNIFRKEIPIVSSEVRAVMNRSTSDYCRRCPAFRYCRGGCYRYVGQEAYCYYRRRMLEFLRYAKAQCSDYILPMYTDNID